MRNRTGGPTRPNRSVAAAAWSSRSLATTAALLVAGAALAPAPAAADAAVGVALPAISAALPPPAAPTAPPPASPPARPPAAAGWEVWLDGIRLHAGAGASGAGEPPDVPVAALAWWARVPAVGGPDGLPGLELGEGHEEGWRLPADRIASAFGLELRIDAGTRRLDLAPSSKASLIARGPLSPAVVLADIGASRATYVDLDADGALEIVAYSPSDGRSPQWISVLRRADDVWRRASRAALPADHVDAAELSFISPLGEGWQVHARSGVRDALYHWDRWLQRLERIRWDRFGADVDLTRDAPPPPRYGDLIRVDKTRNVLFLYRGGTILKAYPIATGRGDLTPVGRFEIVVKAEAPAWKNPDGKIIAGDTPANPLGPRWLGLSAGAEPGYVYGIHGTNEPYSVGSPASSGCIRMLNAHVEELYDLVPRGTPVEVY